MPASKEAFMTATEPKAKESKEKETPTKKLLNERCLALILAFFLYKKHVFKVDADVFYNLIQKIYHEFEDYISFELLLYRLFTTYENEYESSKNTVRHNSTVNNVEIEIYNECPFTFIDSTPDTISISHIVENEVDEYVENYLLSMGYLPLTKEEKDIINNVYKFAETLANSSVFLELVKETPLTEEEIIDQEIEDLYASGEDEYTNEKLYQHKSRYYN